MRVDVNGIELRDDIVGAGEPLLWARGYFGAGRDWRHVFAAPPPGCRLIAPDLRGHGASTNPSGTFSFREAARDLAAPLRHLGLTRVKAIGLSGGGIALLHLATPDATAIGPMVVVGAPPYFPPQARAIQRQTLEAVLGEAAMAEMRRRPLRGEPQIQQLLANSRAFAGSNSQVTPRPARSRMSPACG